MKKLIIVVSIIFVIIGIVYLIYNRLNITENQGVINDIYNMYSTDVDDGVSYLRTSEGFNRMSKKNQVSAIDELLKIYEKNNIIKYLNYENSNLMFTFTYNYGEIKGALGGVMLKDWDPMMN